MEKKEEIIVLNPEEWVDRYGDLLFNYARFRVSHPEEAEDLVQETFLAAFRGRHSFQGASKESTWLLAILKRKIADKYRQRIQYVSVEPENDRWPFYQSGLHEGHWDDAYSPEKWGDKEISFEDSEFYQVFLQCLSHLPQKMATIFTMKSLDEENSDHICKEAGISPSNLWVLIHRARLRLRECMEKNWFL